MTSSDREILISIQGEIHKINVRLDEHTASLAVINRRLDVIEARFDMLLWSVGIGFAVLAVIMGISTWVITALTLRPKEREQNPAPAQNFPANDSAPAIIQSIIELMRFTRESDKH